MHRLFLILIVLFITALSHPAAAHTCRIPQSKDVMAAYDVIFKGRALATHRSYLLWKPKGQPDSYTDFEVLEVFKGDIGQKIRIYHSRKQDAETPPIIFESDTIEMVFAHRRAEDDFYRTDTCIPRAITESALRSLQ